MHVTYFGGRAAHRSSPCTASSSSTAPTRLVGCLLDTFRSSSSFFFSLVVASVMCDEAELRAGRHHASAGGAGGPAAAAALHAAPRGGGPPSDAVIAADVVSADVDAIGWTECPIGSVAVLAASPGDAPEPVEPIPARGLRARRAPRAVQAEPQLGLRSQAARARRRWLVDGGGGEGRWGVVAATAVDSAAVDAFSNSASAASLATTRDAAASSASATTRDGGTAAASSPTVLRPAHVGAASSSSPPYCGHPTLAPLPPRPLHFGASPAVVPWLSWGLPLPAAVPLAPPPFPERLRSRSIPRRDSDLSGAHRRCRRVTRHHSGARRSGVLNLRRRGRRRCRTGATSDRRQLQRCISHLLPPCSCSSSNRLRRRREFSGAGRRIREGVHC